MKAETRTAFKQKLESVGRILLDFARNSRLGGAGAIIVALFVIVGVFAPWIAPKDPNDIIVRDALKSPGAEYILGADNNGRDLLSRIIFGARVSLSLSLAAVGLGAVTGVSLGMLAGWYRRLEAPIMRLVDGMLCFPGIVIALTTIAVLGTGLVNVVIAIAIAYIPEFARLSRGIILSVRETTYIEAAVSVGVPNRRIIGRHILPNIISPIIIQVSLMIPGAIMTLSGLSFLGLGVVPPTPEWGGMLQTSITYSRTAPHFMLYPGLALMLVVFGFNTLGDGLRDFLDPRLRKL